MVGGDQFARVVLCAAGLVVTSAPDAVGDVTFYLQRHGSDGDDGAARFAAALDNHVVVDFEDPLLYPTGTRVSTIFAGDVELDVLGSWGSPNVPTVVYSGEFNAEGRVWVNALLPGIAMTISTRSAPAPQALGFWIFDDGRAADSAYLLEVTDATGSVWRAMLVNEIPLDGRGHEIEGFVGATSGEGILSFTVYAVDPATGQPFFDFFEIDHLTVGFLPPSPVPAPDSSGCCCRHRKSHCGRPGLHGRGHCKCAGRVPAYPVRRRLRPDCCPGPCDGRCEQPPPYRWGRRDDDWNGNSGGWSNPGRGPS